MIIFLLALTLLCVSLYDLKNKVVLDGVTLVGMLLALNTQLLIGDIHACVWGITAGIGAVWAGNLVGIHRLGGGDAKLLALIGSFLGWQIALLTWALSVLAFNIWFHRAERQQLEPYAPFITAGYLIGVIAWHAATLFSRT